MAQISKIMVESHVKGEREKEQEGTWVGGGRELRERKERRERGRVEGIEGRRGRQEEKERM